MAEHLEKAHHGQIADVGEEAATLGPEPVAAEAEDLEGARLIAQVTDEVAGVQVARGLAAGDEHPAGRGRSGRSGHAGGVYRESVRRTMAQLSPIGDGHLRRRAPVAPASACSSNELRATVPGGGRARALHG